MKIYGPDIDNDGDHIVTFYENVDNKEVPIVEFHTNNRTYAQIYYDTISTIINGTPKGMLMTTKSLGWKREGLKRPLPVVRLENPWDDIGPKTYKQCPIKYKVDLVKWAVSKMKWTVTKANNKSVTELKKLWCYKNQSSPIWKGRIK